MDFQKSTLPVAVIDSYMRQQRRSGKKKKEREVAKMSLPFTEREKVGVGLGETSVLTARE